MRSIFLIMGNDVFDVCRSDVLILMLMAYYYLHRKVHPRIRAVSGLSSQCHGNAVKYSFMINATKRG